MWRGDCIEDPHSLTAPSSPVRYPFDSTGPIPYLLASARRKRLIVAGSIFSAFSLLLVPYLLLSLPFARYTFTGLSIFVSQDKPANDSAPVWDRKSVLLGPPTDRFRDNLRNDTKYITSWTSAGWTNDVMTFGNLIYLAVLTERVPIIGPFSSFHRIGGRGDVGTIQFSEVFDIDYLSKMIGVPVLEWHEVKKSSSQEIEDIGCWSVWQAVKNGDTSPRQNNALEFQGLDISFTAGPSSLQIRPGNEHDPSSRFWDIASLLYPPDKDDLKSPQPSRVHGVAIPPDEQLGCFDYLYYVCASHPFEYEYDVSPAWRFVVKHFRWTKRLENIADSYLRRIFGVHDHEPIPPYIAIHARRSDFMAYCGDLPPESCFPSIRVYQRRVADIRREIRSRGGVAPQHVIMLSDEEDSDWWDLIRMAGWYTTSDVAEDAVKKYGKWYPLLIDVVIQSSGVGLIGTAASTMSLLAGRRIQDWHNGVYEEVKWGTPNADDH